MPPPLLSPSRALVGDPDLARDILIGSNALCHGHFRLLADLHTDTFIAFSRIASSRRSLDLIADWLAPSVAGWQPTALLAPSTAGVALASAIALRLGLPLYLAHLDEDGRATGIIGAHPPTDSCMGLVNDVVTTGEGIKRLAAVTREAGSMVAGATWFASRTDVDVGRDLSIPTAHVLDVPIAAWQSSSCELCQTEIEVQDALDLN